ncbi:MAG: hypothetical protein GY774_24880 [Planctomycetes bacterium]|nr:hypothetical protein [Planctomycetota bacterium]
MADKCLHEAHHAVARVADAPRVDDFPLPAWIYGRKERPQPAAERGPVIVGPSVGRRASETEDPGDAVCLVHWELLVIEPVHLGIRRREDVLPIGRSALYEERRVAGKPDVRIGPLVQGNNTRDPQDPLHGEKETQCHGKAASKSLGVLNHAILQAPQGLNRISRLRALNNICMI